MSVNAKQKDYYDNLVNELVFDGEKAVLIKINMNKDALLTLIGEPDDKIEKLSSAEAFKEQCARKGIHENPIDFGVNEIWVYYKVTDDKPIQEKITYFLYFIDDKLAYLSAFHQFTDGE